MPVKTVFEIRDIARGTEFECQKCREVKPAKSFNGNMVISLDIVRKSAVRSDTCDVCAGGIKRKK